jgi:hypothetical protein
VRDWQEFPDAEVADCPGTISPISFFDGLLGAICLQNSAPIIIRQSFQDEVTLRSMHTKIIRKEIVYMEMSPSQSNNPELEG